jgi:hypothetical protein
MGRRRGDVTSYRKPLVPLISGAQVSGIDTAMTLLKMDAYPLPIGKTEYYRVPIYAEKDGKFTVFVGKGSRRFLDIDSLPDEVRNKLTMVMTHAQSYNWRCRGYSSDGDSFNYTDLFHNTYTPEWADIGWCAHEQMFLVVVHRDILFLMKGKPIDAGNEGQEES